MKKAEKLTAPARKLLREAFEEASKSASLHVGSEHLLMALSRNGGSFASKILAEHGLTEESLSAHLKNDAAEGSAGATPLLGLSENGRMILARAAIEAAKRGMPSVTAEHIVLGLLSERDCTAARILESRGIDGYELAEKLFERSSVAAEK